MNAPTHLNAWLEAWGRQAGIDLAPDQGGNFNFAADDMPVRLGIDAEHESLLLAAILLDENLSEAPAAMRALLGFSHLGGPSRRCGVSMADNGRPVLWLWTGLTGLDATALANTLDGFVSTARAGRLLLASAQAIAPPRQPNEPGGLPPFFLRV